MKDCDKAVMALHGDIAGAEVRYRRESDCAKPEGEETMLTATRRGAQDGHRLLELTAFRTWSRSLQDEIVKRLPHAADQELCLNCYKNEADDWQAAWGWKAMFMFVRKSVSVPVCSGDEWGCSMLEVRLYRGQERGWARTNRPSLHLLLIVRLLPQCVGASSLITSVSNYLFVCL